MSAKPHQLWAAISVDTRSRSDKTNVAKTSRATHREAFQSNWRDVNIPKQFRHASKKIISKKLPWLVYASSWVKRLTALTTIVIYQDVHFNAHAITDSRVCGWQANISLKATFSAESCDFGAAINISTNPLAEIPFNFAFYHYDKIRFNLVSLDEC